MREVAGGLRKRFVAELRGCLGEQRVAERLLLRRRRVGPRARPFERVAAGLGCPLEIAGGARGPAQILELVVMRLQFAISPIISLTTDSGAERDVECQKPIWRQIRQLVVFLDKGGRPHGPLRSANVHLAGGPDPGDEATLLDPPLGRDQLPADFEDRSSLHITDPVGAGAHLVGNIGAEPVIVEACPHRSAVGRDEFAGHAAVLRSRASSHSVTELRL